MSSSASPIMAEDALKKLISLIAPIKYFMDDCLSDFLIPYKNQKSEINQPNQLSAPFSFWSPPLIWLSRFLRTSVRLSNPLA